MNNQAEFDHFHTISKVLLDKLYPKRTVSMTNRNPDYIIAEIKLKLWCKKRLMRAGRVEEAGALSVQSANI